MHIKASLFIVKSCLHLQTFFLQKRSFSWWNLVCLSWIPLFSIQSSKNVPDGLR
jgi:hypothetical protein